MVDIRVNDGLQVSFSSPDSEEVFGVEEDVTPFAPDSTHDTNDIDIKRSRQVASLWKNLSSFVPSRLQGWLMNQMTWLVDVLDRIESIEGPSKEDVEWMMVISKQLPEFSYNLQSYFLDNASLSLLGLERIQNMFWRSSHISIARVNINMTLANKIDPSGNLGTAFKKATLKFLQKEFGYRSVSKNPEQTSFTILYAQEHQLTDTFSRAEREIKHMLQYEYNIPSHMLDVFKPAFTAMLMTESNLPIFEIVQNGFGDLSISVIEHILFQKITESLRLLAAGSTLAEKEPETIGLLSGLMVYNVNSLPLDPEMEGYSVLQQAIANGLGYVPASKYISDVENATFYDIKPRPAHEFGRLDHEGGVNSDGGYLQQFISAVDELAKSYSTARDFDSALLKVKSAVQNLRYALQIGWIAQLNPRNHDFIKWSQEIVLHDGTPVTEYPFVQHLSSVSSEEVNVAAVEVDSFKAFTMANNSGFNSGEEVAVDLRKEMDGDFWEIFEAFKEVAKEMNIVHGEEFDSAGAPILNERRKPLMTSVAGDLIVIAIPTTDLSGNLVKFEDYLREVQARVVKKYSDRPFQDYMKVEVPNGVGIDVVRLPLWEKKGESNPAKRFIASKTRPEGYEPYMRTVSITVIGRRIKTPRTKRDVSRFIERVNTMSEKLDDLKNQTAPEKNALKILKPVRYPIGVEIVSEENQENGGPVGGKRRTKASRNQNNGLSATVNAETTSSHADAVNGVVAPTPVSASGFVITTVPVGR